MIVYVYCFIVLLSRLRNFAVDTFIVKTMDIFCSGWEEIFQKKIVRKFPTRKFSRKFSKKLQANSATLKIFQKNVEIAVALLAYIFMSMNVGECRWSARKLLCLLRFLFPVDCS